MTEFEYFKSKKFQESVNKQIKKETWNKDLPKIYMEDGKLIKHYKDGTKEIIDSKELTENDLNIKSNNNRKNSKFIID